MKRKRLLIFLILIIVVIIAVGCGAEKKETLSYDDYKNDFFQLVSKFDPDGFTNISNDVYTSVTASFPANKLSDKKIDAVDDNIEIPYRYETYYLSDDYTVLVHVNFIYHPENTENEFLTIYGVGNSINSNIAEEYQSILRPSFKDYLISLNGYFVDLKFIDISQSSNQEEISEQLNNEFSSKRIDFYEQFEDILLSIIDERMK